MELQCAAGMLTIMHPGAPSPVRARAVDVEMSSPIRLVVPVGCDLFHMVHERLQAVGADGGAFTLGDGAVERLSLMTGGAGRDGQPMGFHGPHAMDGPLAVVAGAAGSGIDEEGRRFTHCHAVFRDRHGRLVGGHLIPGETIAGTDGIVVELTALSRGRFQRRFDPETLFSIFYPEQI